MLQAFADQGDPCCAFYAGQHLIGSALDWELRFARMPGWEEEEIGDEDETAAMAKIRASQDFGRGLTWLHLASQRGEMRARHALGMYLVNGTEFSSRDWSAGLQLVKSAADSGDSDAMRDLGLFLLRRKDESAKVWSICVGGADQRGSAEHWLYSSAQQGNESALTALGTLYSSQGRHEIANYWWAWAARRGRHYAAWKLGESLAKGQGAEKDEATAVACYLFAAQDMWLEAPRVSLEYHFYHGRGVRKDRVLACAWGLIGPEHSIGPRLDYFPAENETAEFLARRLRKQFWS